MITLIQICEAQARGGWKTAFDVTTKSVFTHKENQWISYENQRSVQEKVGRRYGFVFEDIMI